MSATRNLTLSLLALSLSATACQKDEPGIVAENGVWTLTFYDVNGTGSTAQINQMTRQPYQIKFDRDRGIASVATCVDLSGNSIPGQAGCDILFDHYECSCYAYDFSGSNMRMVKYTPGGEIPDSSTASPTVVSKDTNSPSSYVFKPFPVGLWGSNGATSAYVMMKISPTLFMETGCETVCG